MRTTCDSVLTVLSAPYIAAAVVRGEGRWAILRRHVLRNTMSPILTIVALMVAGLPGGALIVETIFSLPGVGQLMVEAVMDRDYGVVQAGVLISVFIFVAFNSLADLLSAVIDPRTSKVGAT